MRKPFTMENLNAMKKKIANNANISKKKESLLNQTKRGKKPHKDVQEEIYQDKKNEIFFNVLNYLKIPLPEKEYKFHHERKWRFDFCWKEKMIALEVEGGVWSNGRHTRGSGFIKDMEKYNAAAVLGYRVVRCMPSELCKIETMNLLKSIL
jgi:hypothetical protein